MMTTTKERDELRSEARSGYNGLVRKGFKFSELYKSFADYFGRKKRKGFAAFFEERSNEHYFRSIELMRLVKANDWTMELSFDESPEPDADWGRAVDVMLEAREMETEVAGGT